MPRNRSVSLRVHLGRSEAAWSLVQRTSEPGRDRDRRIDFGTLAYGSRGDGPPDVLPLLARALRECYRRHGLEPRTEGAPGALGGGGGRYDHLPERDMREGGPWDTPGVDQPLPGL